VIVLLVATVAALVALVRARAGRRHATVHHIPDVQPKAA
jgi:hypothetical protein